MRDPYDFDGLDRYSEFYFVFSDYTIDPIRKPDSYKSPWELWVATLARARQGDFSLVPAMLDLYSHVDDYVLKGQCVDILSDAAPAATVSLIRDSILRKVDRGEGYDPQFVVDMSTVLFMQRQLADIPLLLRIYQGGVEFEDTEIIATYIFYILGDVMLSGGKSNIESDSELVLTRFEQLMSKYGTGEISLWQGEPFTIVDFVKYALMDSNVTDPLTLRHIFEATTGIDCRCFFKNEEYQALAASAVLEEFLESPESVLYDSGVRYFFSHRIP